MVVKKLKVNRSLILPIKSCTKYTTWRVDDDKDLTPGDLLSFRASDTNKEFARARIIWVKLTTFGNLSKEDYLGHEAFGSQSEMIATYEGYYNRRIDLNTLVKVVRFDLVYAC